MDKIKERLDQLKEFVGKLSRKVKILIVAGAAALLIGAVAIALVLNNRPYEVLFTGLTSEEAQEIAARLQEEGIDYRFEGDSTIQVREDVVDQTKATLVQEGYPSSGFTYDTFTNNAGLMTTDSDKNTYRLYELQDRIGATIRLFDGVSDAKVTIALGEESRYALNDEAEQSTGTAVVIMEDGGSPTEEQAAAIQRLVAKSVPNMGMEDVAVFDGNGNDVSVEDGGTGVNGSDAEEIASVVQDQIADNVMKVLSPIYGEGNVRVSARATINMESLMRESTTYETPEKIDEQDKTGIVSHEELYEEGAGTGDLANGVAGAETNADATEYNTDGTTDNGGSYSESTVRDYLVNQIIEQGQTAAGALEDLTVSVAINGDGYGSLNEAQLRALVANAAGIAADQRAEKIAIVSAPFDGTNDTQTTPSQTVGGLLAAIPPWGFVIGGVALLILLLTVFLLLRRRRRRRMEEEEAELLAMEEAEADEGIDMNQELQELQNDKSMQLKRNIREFAEQNAEISAQLLRSWLNGGNGDGE